MTSPHDVCITCKHPRYVHANSIGICTHQEPAEHGGPPPVPPCHCNLFREEPPAPAPEPATVCATCNGGGAAWGPVGCPACCTDDPCRVHAGCPQPEVQSIYGCCGDPVVDGKHICPVDLVPREFIMAVGRNMREGLKGHSDRYVGSWKDLTKEQARTKLHNMYVHAGDAEFDAVACNALILWWHLQRKEQG